MMGFQALLESTVDWRLVNKDVAIESMKHLRIFHKFNESPYRRMLLGQAEADDIHCRPMSLSNIDRVTGLRSLVAFGGRLIEFSISASPVHKPFTGYDVSMRSMSDTIDPRFRVCLRRPNASDIVIPMKCHETIPLLYGHVDPIFVDDHEYTVYLIRL